MQKLLKLTLYDVAIEFDENVRERFSLAARNVFDAHAVAEQMAKETEKSSGIRATHVFVSGTLRQVWVSL